jgi:hypothetical protein
MTLLEFAAKMEHAYKILEAKQNVLPHVEIG